MRVASVTEMFTPLDLRINTHRATITSRSMATRVMTARNTPAGTRSIAAAASPMSMSVAR